MTAEETKTYAKIAERYEKRILSTYLRKETAEDKAFHYYVRTLWVRTCDMALVLRHRLYKLVSNIRVRK